MELSLTAKRAKERWTLLDDYEKKSAENLEKQSDRLIEKDAPKSDMTHLLIQMVESKVTRIEQRQKILYSIGMALLEFRNFLIYMVALYFAIELLKRLFS